MRASQKIQILKTISWTIISIAITTGVGWAISGSLAIGVSVGLVDRAIKMALYFTHERVWHKQYKALKRKELL
jgi:uncharacterized membrane protein